MTHQEIEHAAVYIKVLKIIAEKIQSKNVISLEFDQRSISEQLNHNTSSAQGKIDKIDYSRHILEL